MAESYFLGAMTQYGFSTEIGKLIDDKDYFTYILKGGPGTGKSTLMKKIAEEFGDGEHIIKFYCSSDPHSLDAVVLCKSKIIVVDGTSPHVFDPVYPGVHQKIVNLGDSWNDDTLKKHGDKIISVTDKNKSLLARAKRFSGALSNICYDTYFCSQNFLDTGKLTLYVNRLAKKIMNKKSNGSGSKIIRQLSALTEYGYVIRNETLDSYIDVYSINDKNFSAANKFIEIISDEAVKRGFDVIVCPSVVFNNDVYENVLIPELGIAFISNSDLTNIGDKFERHINLERFYDKDFMTQMKSRFKLNKTYIKNLVVEISDTIKTAKSFHDEIEKYYIEAMNFQKIEDVGDVIINEIKNNNK